MKKGLPQALVESGMIIFPFYATLLMGEFTRQEVGRTDGLRWALSDIVTSVNLVIALVASGLGYGAFEILRRRS